MPWCGGAPLKGAARGRGGQGRRSRPTPTLRTSTEQPSATHNPLQGPTSAVRRPATRRVQRALSLLAGRVLPSASQLHNSTRTREGPHGKPVRMCQRRDRASSYSVAVSGRHERAARSASERS